MRAVVNSDDTSVLTRWPIDALVELYVCWREECRAVRDAYEWWGDSDRGQRTLAYAGYVAALDREQQAAYAYADQIDLVSRICA
ncbi:MAG: hypothetical protein QOD66_2428 [Solirubrobacteraceae bacterium]|jgi:hypothetical protein|nr:hypothetical protein [Solirubrobacteraceae bacterium]